MRIPALLLSATLATYSATPAALERLTLQVTCNLAEHRYRLDLTDDEIEQIETDCATGVAGLLGQKIGFLDFVAGEPRNNRLEIRIGKTSQEADSSAIRAVNFEIEVSGDNVTNPGKPVIWSFRSVDEYLDVPAAMTFADAITIRFGELLEHGEAQLVRDQLGRLAIAGSAFPMPTDQSWLLPFSREELGIDDNSEFRIKAALVFPSSEERFTYHVILFGDFASASHVPAEFHHKVKALHLRDDKLEDQAESIQRLRRASDVRVEYVSISRYVPAILPERTSPSDLAGSQAGGG